MERKMIAKFLQLFATFYAGINLIGFGLEHKLSSATQNHLMVATGVFMILFATSYCISKCVITYLVLTNKQN